MIFLGNKLKYLRFNTDISKTEKEELDNINNIIQMRQSEQ